MTWAVIGTGTISQSIVPDLQSVPGCEVSIVHSRDAGNAARFAAKFGVLRATDDYDAILQDPSVDAVYIATPFATHHDLASRALRAGKHTLVEKPIAMNRAEVADLFAIAAAADVFVMEAMWMKFNPAYRRLHAEIAGGRIGETRSVRASFGMPAPGSPDGSRWDLARSGGALLDQGIYPVTLAQSLFGAPLAVRAEGTTRDDGLDLDEHITLDFGEGRYAQLSSSMTHFTELSASVAGSLGWMTLNAPFWATVRMDIHAGDLRRIFRDPEHVQLDREGFGYVPMLRSVADAVRDRVREHPVHTHADTLSVFSTMDDVLRQLRTVTAGSDAVSN